RPNVGSGISRSPAGFPTGSATTAARSSSPSSRSPCPGRATTAGTRAPPWATTPIKLWGRRRWRGRGKFGGPRAPPRGESGGAETGGIPEGARLPLAKGQELLFIVPPANLRCPAGVVEVAPRRGGPPDTPIRRSLETGSHDLPVSGALDSFLREEWAVPGPA